ncbi:prolyl oligopeptidase family serine peptidase [Stieleria sp. JC731]|uniref:prolyl oligopeptidase family serine peptidase n=1 Tax=Pirellulaceae TaxID=2691357 RepID=UPI001E30FB37|nr:prolyl oligopeptidase family serine peptidase [Stieleria sp. JC731]MCC9603210.1 prolyl oligopeptidase family serine peptidase [Stieleria sp. JC731]
MLRRSLLFGSLLFASCGLADGPADNIATSVRPIPPVGIQADGAKIELLRQRCESIRKSMSAVLVEAAQATKTSKSWQKSAAIAHEKNLASLQSEILVFPRAVELAIVLNQFYKESELDNADKLLDEAAARIERAKSKADWSHVVGFGSGENQQLIIGGYTSKIDDSYQPYALVVPSGFTANDRRPRRLDLWFHGRGEKLSEVNFLWTGQNNAGQYTPDDTFVLHPFGRYSNAFKFAGEVDVFESLEYLKTRLPVDSQRIAARGFSMGGAACWQFATHYPDQFFAANPGAGFSETPEFLKSFQQEDLAGTPEFQRTLWQLYDCPPWARNLIHCPTVAYSGEIDKQKQAADVMQSALREHHIDLVHIIGPDTAHKIHEDSKVEIEKRMDQLANLVSRETPDEIDFTTYTLRYNRMHWLKLTGLVQHWAKAHVEAKLVNEAQVEIQSENVTALTLDFGPAQWQGDYPCRPAIAIDGQTIEGPAIKSDRSWNVKLVNQNGKWSIGQPDRAIRKKPGIQGPIDDAFMDAFIFVLPTRTSSDKAFHQWAEQEAKHAMNHWRKHFRGDIRVVKDIDVTKEMIASKNLIAFGDSESNTLLARLADALPVRWTADQIQLGSQSFPRTNHAGIFVSPNPLNPDRYIVANSGFTFREYDYLNNARQTPKLPDWAIVDITDGATTRAPGRFVDAGFFNEHWEAE